MKKLYAINNCLKIYILHTYKQKNGSLYQPNGVNVRLKTLFSTFAMKGIPYRLAKDFNFPEGFATYLKELWKLENKVDNTFGNRPNKYSPPDDLLDQVRNSILCEHKLDISGENLLHSQLAFFFSSGFSYIFRGCNVSCYLLLVLLFRPAFLLC